MGGDEAAGDFLGSEHHAVALGPGSLDEDLGVAGMGDPSQGECFLVEGAGDDAVKVPREGRVDGVGQVVVGCFARGFTDLCGDEALHRAEVDEVSSDRQAGGEGDVVEDLIAAEDREIGFKVRGVLHEEAQAELRPDSGGISHGDG